MGNKDVISKSNGPKKAVHCFGLKERADYKGPKKYNKNRARGPIGQLKKRLGLTLTAAGLSSTQRSKSHATLLNQVMFEDHSRKLGLWRRLILEKGTKELEPMFGSSRGVKRRPFSKYSHFPRCHARDEGSYKSRAGSGEKQNAIE